MSHPNNSGFCKKTSSIVHDVSILYCSEGRDNRDVFSSWFGPWSLLSPLSWRTLILQFYKKIKYIVLYLYLIYYIVKNVTVNYFLKRFQFIFYKTSVKISINIKIVLCYILISNDNMLHIQVISSLLTVEFKRIKIKQKYINNYY